MEKVIHLHRPEDGITGPRRLNLFAGRYLGEREFDLRQAYADARLQGLLAHRQPGVVHGLAVELDTDNSIRVQPGTAVAADGQPVRLFFPLDTHWDDVVTAHLASEAAGGISRVDGHFLLTLRRVVYIREPGDIRHPCTRTEPNPLHDSTVETSAYLDLQAIVGLPPLTGRNPDSEANQICVFHTHRSPFADGEPSVPVALVRVANNQLVWLDPVAGRYEAMANAPYRTLLAHYQSVINRLVDAQQRGEVDVPSARAHLNTHLGVDYLPSAGPLPDYLVRDIAGSPAAGGQWKPPKLAFTPDGLQIELVPIPLSDVLPTLRREMNRPPVELVNHSEDRIRVLVAIPDTSFKPELLDLPSVDEQLEDQLVERGQTANDDYLYWRYVYDWLYADLENHVSPEQLVAAGVTVNDEGQPLVPPGPRTPRAFFVDMIDDRSAGLPEGEEPPAPYAWGPPDDVPAEFDVPADTDYVAFNGTSLHVLEEQLATKIQWLEEELDENDRLLGAFDTFLSLQRQQVDSVTLSLSSLAGGVPGDGSGLKFLKWTPFTTLKSDGGV